MSKLKAIKLKDVKAFLVKIPRALAKRAFWVFLGLFLLSSIVGFFVYYRYATLIKKVQPQTTEKRFKFKSKTYQETLTIWQEKEERFEQVSTKEYPNLFVP